MFVEGNMSKRKRHLDGLSGELVGDLDAAGEAGATSHRESRTLRGLSSKHHRVEELLLLVLHGGHSVEQLLRENHIAATAAAASAAHSYALERR